MCKVLSVDWLVGLWMRIGAEQGKEVCGKEWSSYDVLSGSGVPREGGTLEKGMLEMNPGYVGACVNLGKKIGGGERDGNYKKDINEGMRDRGGGR